MVPNSTCPESEWFKFEINAEFHDKKLCCISALTYNIKYMQLFHIFFLKYIYNNVNVMSEKIEILT